MIAVTKIVKNCLRRYWYVAVSILILLSGQLIWSGQSQINGESLDLSVRFPMAQSSGWHQVKIGGGGYITGVYAHPLEPDLVYLQTDNGGFFRWQKDQTWLPITNSLPLKTWKYDPYSGGEALALDPQNPDIIYIAVGKYTVEPGRIYKSTDRGQSWQQLDLSVPMGADQDKRWAGNRLAVSPHNSNLILFGSRTDGLWRSPDGGESWTVASLPLADNDIGALALAFDPQIPNLVYASVYDDGVYQSTDGGINWIKLPASPSQAMKLAVAQDSTLYVTGGDQPRVSRYAQRQWHDITPSGSKAAFNGLSLDPQNPQALIVAEAELGRGKIYYSQDQGRSWQRQSIEINNTVAWLDDRFFGDHIAAVVFDPLHPGRVWMSDWFSLWRTDDITANPVQWQNYVAGIEQTVPLTLLAPPKGAVLLSGIADQEGFYHHDLDQYPQRRLGYTSGEFINLNFTGKDYLDNYFQDTHDLAYCVAQPLNLARVGGKRWRDTYRGASSADGGKTWQLWQNFPPHTMAMRVAIATNNPQRLVVVNSQAPALVSDDGGNSWQRVSGLPDGIKGPWNWNQPLAADGKNGDRFYYYDRGQVYRSDDGGKSFRVVSTSLPVADTYSLQVMPWVEGELWLSLSNQGLYQSSDGGTTFRKIDSIKAAHRLSIGKSLDHKGYSPYIYGTVDETSGLFTSLDQGDWLQIGQADIPRALLTLEASHQQAGLIFAGTDGRGIYYQLAQMHPRDNNQNF